MVKPPRVAAENVEVLGPLEAMSTAKAATVRKAVGVTSTAVHTAELQGLSKSSGLRPELLAAGALAPTARALGTRVAFAANPGFKARPSVLAAWDAGNVLNSFPGILGGHLGTWPFKGSRYGSITDAISSWFAVNPVHKADFSAVRYQHLASGKSLSPISALFDQVGQASKFTSALLGNGATNDALNRLSRLDYASAAVASIASSVKPYQLPDLVLMTDLARSRALFHGATPLAGPVDRIGMGWASLSDRVVRGDLDLANLMPSSNRLATKAYRLDILVGQEEPTDDEELLTTRRDQWDVVAEHLARLDPVLSDCWVGVWDRMGERGPDWKSQTGTSAVELLNGLLNTLAPDDTVRAWQVASGQHNNPDLYQKYGKKGPTRRLRLLHLGHIYRLSRVTVQSVFMAVPGAIDDIQGVKHHSSDEAFEVAVSLLGDAITLLVPERRR